MKPFILVMFIFCFGVFFLSNGVNAHFNSVITFPQALLSINWQTAVARSASHLYTPVFAAGLFVVVSLFVDSSKARFAGSCLALLLPLLLVGEIILTLVLFAPIAPVSLAMAVTSRSSGEYYVESIPQGFVAGLWLCTCIAALHTAKKSLQSERSFCLWPAPQK